MIFTIAVTVLIFDLSMPLGIAGGVPYVALVMAGYGLRSHHYIYLLALLATVLTLVGYWASPGGGVYWMVLTNRGLAIFAIWVTAVGRGVEVIYMARVEKSIFTVGVC